MNGETGKISCTHKNSSYGGGGWEKCSRFGTEDRKPFENGVSTILQLLVAHKDTGYKAYLTFLQNTMPWAKK